MARLHQAKAHLLLGSLDRAAITLQPVLATEPEHRVRPLLHRAGEVGALLRSPRFRDSPLSLDLQERLADFQTQPARKELLP